MNSPGKDTFDYVCHLSDCTKDSLFQVGGKNSNLGEMINQGFSVPEGFAVTVNAYDLAFKEIRDKVCKELEGLCSTDMNVVDESSNRVRDLIRSVGMPDKIKEEIERQYAELSMKYNINDIPVAVRSSATAEDLPGASFAGQQDTYLWIRGKENLTNAVVDCWASLYTSRAICYRIKKSFEHEQVKISVGVQRMVEPSRAGVMFTINPVNGDRSKIMIGGSWGLGEGVVSGTVSPDEWMVDKVILEISKRTIAPKKLMHEVFVGPEKEEVLVRDVPADKQEIPCLSDDEIIELARIGKKLEGHYGCPQDVEWAIDRALPFPQNIFIVQTRPETVWSEKAKETTLKKSGSPAEQICSYLSNLKA